MKTVEQLRILSDEILQVLYAKALRKEQTILRNA